MNLFFGYVLDIDVTNMKLKVKSEFSLSVGLMLINHSNPYLQSTVLALIIRTVKNNCYYGRSALIRM